MTGNEILLNLDNYENLRNGELISGLLELGKRDKLNEHDWNNHAITAKCLAELKKRLPVMNSNNVIQAAMLLQSLKIINQEAWNLCAKHALKMLHKYKGADLATFLDIFDQDLQDEEGETYGIVKADNVFFERIVGILPIEIKNLNRDQLVRTLEVLVKRNLGSDRLFRDYLLLSIEKCILKLTLSQYIRTLRALADKQYYEDSIFWNQYIFKYIYDTPEAKDGRVFTGKQAKKIWDALIYLKIKCPSIDVKEHIQKMEKFMSEKKKKEPKQPVQQIEVATPKLI